MFFEPGTDLLQRLPCAREHAADQVGEAPNLRLTLGRAQVLEDAPNLKTKLAGALLDLGTAEPVRDALDEITNPLARTFQTSAQFPNHALGRRQRVDED